MSMYICRKMFSLIDSMYLTVALSRGVSMSTMKVLIKSNNMKKKKRKKENIYEEYQLQRGLIFAKII